MKNVLVFGAIIALMGTTPLMVGESTSEPTSSEVIVSSEEVISSEIIEEISGDEVSSESESIFNDPIVKEVKDWIIAVATAIGVPGIITLLIKLLSLKKNSSTIVASELKTYQEQAKEITAKTLTPYMGVIVNLKKSMDLLTQATILALDGTAESRKAAVEILAQISSIDIKDAQESISKIVKEIKEKENKSDEINKRIEESTKSSQGQSGTIDI